MKLGLIKLGKKKLLFLHAVFLIANVLVVGQLMRSFLRPASFIRKYPLLDASRAYTDQKDFVINIVPLRNQLQTLVREQDNLNISLYLEFINTGANITINPDNQVWPASLAKLPLAIVIMKKVENGDLSLKDKLEIKDSYRDDRSGSLASKTNDTKLSVDQLLHYLLVESDNTAQKTFLANITLADIQDLVDSLGLESLLNSDGKLNAREYARLFRALYYSALLTPKDSEYMLDLLSQAEFRDFLSTGLPQNTKFAHKYGEDLDHQIFIDSGIVYLPNRPFSLVVMIQAKDPTQSDNRKLAIEVMRKISKVAYTYFSE